MKEQVITIPNNFEIKEIKDGKIVLVEKEKKLNYEDIAKKLFDVKTIYWIDMFGEIDFYDNVGDSCLSQANNASTEKQLKKLLAINKLMNVAKYLNDGWQPNWDDINEAKYCIAIEDDEIKIEFTWTECYLDIYFKSEELAQQAVNILGEEIIRFALCTDY